MSQWQSIGPEEMLADAEMDTVEVEGEQVLLLRVDGAYHAYQGRCPHRGAELSEGTLEAGVITCPWHGSRFRATNGECLGWVAGLSRLLVPFVKLFQPPEDLDSYPVRIEDGQVWVDVG